MNETSRTSAQAVYETWRAAVPELMCNVPAGPWDELSPGVQEGFGAVAEKFADEVTEHATQMGSGTKCIRYEATFNGKVIYPLAEWIRDSLADGQKVYRRRIIVVEDWAEAPQQIGATEDGA